MLLDSINLNSMSNRIMITGVLYVVIFGFGFLLTRFGNPYSTVLLTVHKLASIAVVFVVYKSFSTVHQAAGLNSMLIIVGVITGIAFIGTVATGGLISIGGDIPQLVYSVHRVMPLLTVISTAACLYLLKNYV